MAAVDACRAVGVDLLTEPTEQQHRHAEARRPPLEVAPGGLVDHVQEEVAAEVEGAHHGCVAKSRESMTVRLRTCVESLARAMQHAMHNRKHVAGLHTEQTK